MKARRARRVHHDWTKEIAKGNVIAFYKSTEWDIAREKALETKYMGTAHCNVFFYCLNQ